MPKKGFSRPFSKDNLKITEFLNKHLHLQDVKGFRYIGASKDIFVIQRARNSQNAFNILSKLWAAHKSRSYERSSDRRHALKSAISIAKHTFHKLWQTKVNEIQEIYYTTTPHKFANRQIREIQAVIALLQL